MPRPIALLLVASCTAAPSTTPSQPAPPEPPEPPAASMLTVTVSGPGRITSDPAGIDCGADGGACSAPLGDALLTASDDVTVHWGGACSGRGRCRPAGGEVTATTFAPQVVTVHEDGGFDAAYALAIDTAGREIVTGEGPSPGTGVVWTSQMAPDGTIAWTDRYDPGHDGHDDGYAVAVGADGSIVVAGQWYSSSNARLSAFARALGPDGAPRWSVTSDAIGDDGYDAVAVDGDATYVAGSSADGASWLRRLDASGATVWEQLGAPGEWRGIAIANGQVVVAGSPGIAAYTPAGTLAWSAALPHDVNALALAPDGTFVVAGATESEAWLARIDGTGAVSMWTTAPEIAAFAGVAVAPDGTISATGLGTTNVYDPGLGKQWSQAQADLHSTGVAVAPDGSTVVCGWSGNALEVITYL